jgi:hypothetical protein
MPEVLQNLLHIRAQLDAMRADILVTVSRRVGLILISQISSGTFLRTDATRADQLLYRRVGE